MQRYLIIVKLEDAIKVAQCGYDDGSPAHTGMDILNFLKENSIAGLKRVMKDVTPYPQDHSEQARLTRSDEYTLGFQVLPQILAGRDRVVLAPHFKDSAFCDWVYILDLDEDMFMVRKGAQASYPIYKLPTMQKFLEDCEVY